MSFLPSFLSSPPGDHLALSPAMIVRLRPGAPRTVLPDVRCDLVWTAEAGWKVAGPQLLPRADVVSRHGVLVSLEPLAARDLLGVPLSHLTGRSFNLADVCAPLARQLNEAASKRPTPEHGRAACPRLAAAEAALRANAGVASAAAVAGWSPRHLERRFQHEFGASPKTFARIVRFRRALQLLRGGASLSAAAYAAGYADQSHFTRDAQVQALTTPRALQAQVANVQDAVWGAFAS